MKTAENKWVQGYACAVATLINLEGYPSTDARQLFAAGIGTVKKAKAAGCDESDMEVFNKFKIQLER